MFKVSTVIGAVLSSIFMFVAMSFLLERFIDLCMVEHYRWMVPITPVTTLSMRIAALILSSAAATFTFRASLNARTGKLYWPERIVVENAPIVLGRDGERLSKQSVEVV